MKALKIICSIATAIIGLFFMCLCSFFLNPTISSFVCFLVFITFAGVISAIWLVGNTDSAKKEAALRLIRILRTKGFEVSEIKRIVMRKFRFDSATMEELSKTAGL